MELHGSLPALIVLLAVALVAAGWDLARGIIPNKLLVLGFLLAAAAHVALPLLAHDFIGIGTELARGAGGALVCGLVPAFLFSKQAMGGGDVKLLALAGFCAGPLRGLDIEAYAFLALLLYAPARLLYQGELLRTLRASGAMLVRGFRASPKSDASFVAMEFKFAPAVALAVCASLLVNGVGP